MFRKDSFFTDEDAQKMEFERARQTAREALLTHNEQNDNLKVARRRIDDALAYLAAEDIEGAIGVLHEAHQALPGPDAR